MRRRGTILSWIAFLSLILPLIGCVPRTEHEVVVYCALDREFSETILDDFQTDSGIRVLPKYDIESTKTVGLVTAIIEEQKRPRCDLFWNNEILHTLRLEKLGLLESYQSPAAEAFPADYVSPEGYWHGFASRARILIVNKDRLPNRDDWPQSVVDLAAERWHGDCAIAKPLFGTTATHAAVLYDRWGEERAYQFFKQVKDNAAVVAGNKQVALGVGRGDFAFGITDTDDAWVEIQRGAPVEIVFPDQVVLAPDTESLESESLGSEPLETKPLETEPLGTLFIPNSLAIVKGSPHQEAAKQLVDYLLSPEVERRLALGASAQIPVNPLVEQRSPVQPDASLIWMDVDFRAAADRWDTASAQLRELFQSVE